MERLTSGFQPMIWCLAVGHAVWDAMEATQVQRGRTGLEKVLFPVEAITLIRYIYNLITSFFLHFKNILSSYKLSSLELYYYPFKVLKLRGLVTHRNKRWLHLTLILFL